MDSTIRLKRETFRLSAKRKRIADRHEVAHVVKTVLIEVSCKTERVKAPIDHPFSAKIVTGDSPADVANDVVGDQGPCVKNAVGLAKMLDVLLKGRPLPKMTC